MNKETDLMIYKQYMELIYYTEMILKKYPKSERNAIVSNIKNNVYDGMKCILCSYKMYNKNDKLRYLNNLDINLKMLKVLIRVSHKNKYINTNNYNAWSKKITNIGNLLGGWIKSCVKQ